MQYYQTQFLSQCYFNYTSKCKIYTNHINSHIKKRIIISSINPITNREITIHRGTFYILTKHLLYISLLPKIHKMKTFHLYKTQKIIKFKILRIQIEKYTYRPSNQTVTNCHTFRKEQTQNGIHIITTAINRNTNNITRRNTQSRLVLI